MVTNLTPNLPGQPDPNWVPDPNQPYGSFSGPIETRWEPDGRGMCLLQSLVYTDGNGVTWEAPAGAVVNGASIPGFLWGVVGSPFTGLYRDASVIHDVACDRRTRTWKATHRAFLSAMLASGVKRGRARMMYIGVYHLGPRWPSIDYQTVLSIDGTETIAVMVPAPPTTLTETQVEALAARVEAEGDGPGDTLTPLEELETYTPELA